MPPKGDDFEKEFLGDDADGQLPPPRKQSLRLSKNKNQKLIARDISESLGKMPPKDEDLEMDVLGSAILERYACVLVLEKLSADDFYLERHKEIFAALKMLADEGAPTDMRSIVSQLRKLGKLEIIGGAYYIVEITAKVSSMISEHHCFTLIEHRIKRDLIMIASEIHHDAYDDTIDALELLAKFSKKPQEIMNSIRLQNYERIKESIMALALEISGRTDDMPEIIGIPSGYYSIDRTTLGWQGGTLIIIAARPSMGKTTFVVNLIRNAALDFNVPTAIFSLEMGKKELVWQFVAIESGLPKRKIMSQKFTPEEWLIFTHSTAKITNAPIFIDDTISLDADEFRLRARQLYEKEGIRIIIVDYLQLMRGGANVKGGREQEIANITRTLKSVSKELGIPIIALSQLSREVEKRTATFCIPMLSDLRESGSIEQDADIVAFLWRPAYYKFTEDSSGTFIDGLTKVIIAKHRNGPLGEGLIAMNGTTSKFRNLDSPYIQYLGPTNNAPQQAEIFNDKPKPPKDEEDLEGTDDTPF